MVKVESELRQLIGGHWRVAARSALGMALLLVIPLAGQSPFAQFPSSRGDRNSQNYPDSQIDQNPNSPEQKRIRLLNAERQKSMVSDAEKLLRLAKELNDEVAASDSGEMNNQQLHKVEEIGKLAKNVKDKMSYSVGGFPSLTPPLTIQPGIQ